MPNASAEGDNQPDTTLQPGQVLEGKYRVDYLLDQGGMAAVWAATNERTGKRVALKMLLQSLAATPAAEALFKREGLAASRVDHPNVVTIFDVIEHQGMACIVMELLTGEPLDRYLARVGTLTLSEARALLLPAMRGAAAAHAQGVVHRDLKPQNIFICVGPDGRPVTTKVLDFGISLIVERALDPAAGALPGVPMGTPAYMAPEQIAALEDIDQRADVYGFGVLFFEALTGRVPFPGEPGAELYDSILNQPAPPLGQLRPDLPPGIARAIDTALAKDPAQRHKNLDVMIAALEDEMLPLTPSPRVPTFASGPVATEPATQFLVSFPLQAGSGGRQLNQSYVTGAPDADGGDLDGDGSDVPHVPSQLGTLAALDGEDSSPAVRTTRRLRRGFLGAGIAGLTGGIGFVLWSFAATNVKPATGVSALVAQPPPVVVPLAPPAGPRPAPVDPPAPATAPAPPATAPAASAAAEETGKRFRHRVRSRKEDRAARVSQVALRDPSRIVEARLPARTGSTGSAALAPPPVKFDASSRSARRRAGPLSPEDF